MDCVICNNGELKPGVSTMTLERGSRVIVIRDVPALLCNNCGETSFEEEVTGKVLDMAEKALVPGVDVVILYYIAKEESRIKATVAR